MNRSALDSGLVPTGVVTVTTMTVNAAGTTCRVHAPAGVAGTVDITITTPSGTTPVVTADRFTYT